MDLLGKPETASSRLDLTQAFNSLGTAIAPKLGGILILSAAPLASAQLAHLAPQALQAYRVQQAASVRVPYAVIGATLILLAIVIGMSKLPQIESATTRIGEESRRFDLEASEPFVWRGWNFRLRRCGSVDRKFLVNYFGLPEIASLSAKTAAGYVSFYWGGAMIGRFVGALLLRRFKPTSLLVLCTSIAVALVATSMTLGGHAAMWSILAVGFFNSIMFPTIFTLGVAELGPLTGSGSGILNMAIVGGAILPLIQGVIADHIGLQHAFFVPIACYLYILFYGLSGSKPNSERKGRHLEIQ